MLLEEGTILRSIYEVERFLGEGAFAEVYRVKHQFLGRQAMKVFKLRGLSPEELENMLMEARLLSQLNHPNIIRVYDAGVLDAGGGSMAYFTMEYAGGGTLESYWRGKGMHLLAVADAVDIVSQVCRGLALAHAENPPIVHRDIKPQNILIGYDSGGRRVKVSDFGLAKRVNALTLLASAHGTMAFKPPEALSNMDSCAADVWAMGVLLYLLLTDQLPFHPVEAADFAKGECWQEPVQPARYYNPMVDENLEKVLQSALALDYRKRYPSANEFLSDLMKCRTAREADHAARSTDFDVSWDEGRVASALEEAKTLSKLPGRLQDAASLLEKVLNFKPELKDDYEYYLNLWRKGVSL
ncbi:MAG: serine/threonine-protein kinase [Syntrophomonas sp.]